MRSKTSAFRARALIRRSMVLAVSLVLAVPVIVIVVQVLVLGGAAFFVLSRPLPPGE